MSRGHFRAAIAGVALLTSAGCSDSSNDMTGPRTEVRPSLGVVAPVGCGVPGSPCTPLPCTITGISAPATPGIPIDGTDTFIISVAGNYAFTVNITEASGVNATKKYEWLSGTYPAGTVFRTQTTTSRSDVATIVVKNRPKSNYWVRVTSVTGPYAGCWIGYTFSIDPSSALDVTVAGPTWLPPMSPCTWWATPVGGTPPYTVTWFIQSYGGGSFSPSSGSGLAFQSTYYSSTSAQFSLRATVTDAGGRIYTPPLLMGTTYPYTYAYQSC